MFNHEHEFRPFPGSTTRLYCPCGEGRDLAAPAAAKAPRTPRAPKVLPSPQLPFSFGNGRSLMDSPDAPPPGIGELDRAFAGVTGANPMGEAEALAELAKTLGVQRMPEGDPPGTYRPGETETPPWIKAP